MVEAAGLLAHSQKVTRQRREDGGLAQRIGNSLAALHSLRHAHERRRNGLVVQGGGSDPDGLHQRDGVGDERRHGAGESRRLGLQQSVAEQWGLQAETVPPEPARGGRRIRAPDRKCQEDRAGADPPVAAEDVARVQHEAGGSRHFHR